MNPKYIIKLQGGIGLLSLTLFLYGYFSGNGVSMIIGGTILVLEDIIAIRMKVLNPLFPILFAIVLSLIFHPWYVGLFWSIAVLSLFNIPTDFMKLFMTDKIMGAIEKHIN